MSHIPPPSLLDLLSENLMFLFGSLYQSDIAYDTNNNKLTLKGVDITYDSAFIDQNIETINTYIKHYQQEESNEDIISLLYDIRRVLEDTKDRLSWLQ
jgi:hypothetical protein